jgi:hypothetical protein
VNFVIFSKTDIRIKIVLIWGDNWLKAFMNTASKEVVCFKTIMQHTLFMPLHLQFPAYVLLKTLLEHSSGRIKYFSSVVID